VVDDNSADVPWSRVTALLAINRLCAPGTPAGPAPSASFRNRIHQPRKLQNIHPETRRFSVRRKHKG
jgi:hypothetical protein